MAASIPSLTQVSIFFFFRICQEFWDRDIFCYLLIFLLAVRAYFSDLAVIISSDIYLRLYRTVKILGLSLMVHFNGWSIKCWSKVIVRSFTHSHNPCLLQILVFPCLRNKLWVALNRELNFQLHVYKVPLYCLRPNFKMLIIACPVYQFYEIAPWNKLTRF